MFLDCWVSVLVVALRSFFLFENGDVPVSVSRNIPAFFCSPRFLVQMRGFDLVWVLLFSTVAHRVCYLKHADFQGCMDRIDRTCSLVNATCCYCRMLRQLQQSHGWAQFKIYARLIDAYLGNCQETERKAEKSKHGWERNNPRECNRAPWNPIQPALLAGNPASWNRVF